MIKIFGFSISLLLILSFISCAQNVSPNTYTGPEVGIVSRVKKGVIIAKRPINIDNNSGGGGIAGGVAGAAAGATVGNSASTQVVGAVGGAVAGAIVGNVLDKSINRHRGFEYIIKLDEGQTISAVQTDEMQFALKQPVLIIYGAMTRIVPDKT